MATDMCVGKTRAIMWGGQTRLSLWPYVAGNEGS